MEQRDGGDFSPKKPTSHSEASSTVPANFPARKVVRQLDRHIKYFTSTGSPATTVREAEPAAKTITPSAARDAFYDEATASAASCTTFSSFHTLPCGILARVMNSNRALTHYEQNPTKGQTMLFVEYLSYADNYPVHDSVRWDTGAGFVERGVAYQPWLWTAGNHELDYVPEIYSRLINLGFRPTVIMPLSKHQTVLLCGILSREHQFRSYCCLHTRNRGNYTPQYKWIEEELPKVNRSETPCILRCTIATIITLWKVMPLWAGRSDYVVLTEDAVSFAFGWNKHEQLGSVSTKNVEKYESSSGSWSSHTLRLQMVRYKIVAALPAWAQAIIGLYFKERGDDYAADAEEYEEKMEQEILLKSLQDFLGRLVVSNGGKMRVI
ncbi:hypothetical protein OROMI_028534 [Orobanche minor]